MVIKQLMQHGTRQLSDNGIQTPQLDAAVLLCYVLGKNRSYLVINYNEQVGQSDCERYMSLIQKRAAGMPTAYITGLKEFMSLDFYVDENVLIPRSDTETLCEYILEHKDSAAPEIADICCGSGCIGISLAAYIKKSRVTMADISKEALAVARINAERHNVLNRCSFIRTDILKQTIDSSFDIVVSNPPYIETDVIASLERDVAEYEPRIALDGGADGLTFYRRLADIVPHMLKSGGIAAFEVGHTQADKVMDMMREGFYGIEAVCDLAGIRRVVCGKRK